MSEEQKEVPIEVRLEAANKRVEELEGLCGLFAQIHKNNIRLGEQISIMLKGLTEISKIKGNPPVQVARTIAQRTFGEVAKYIKKATDEDKEEQSNNNCLHPGTGLDSKDSQHEAGDIPSRIG